MDNDCDGIVDDGAVDASTWYADSDGDGHGDAGTSAVACTAPSGHVATDDDGDDANGAVHPSASEICDTIDNDCDGDTDEDDATDATTWYGDLDGDGYGGTWSTTTSCSQPTGYVASSDDCDDLESFTYPGAPELCDSRDNDCDGDVDEEADLVGGSVSTWYADADGYGNSSTSSVSCSQPSGYVANSSDCDDAVATTHPGAAEVWYDGVDADCAGDDDYDADADGVQSYQEAGGADCDDSDASSTTCGGSSASALTSCQELRTADLSLGSGNYWINPGGVPAFQVECDMTTESGGWIVLSTDRARNYWDFSFSSSNNTDKCGYDGLSTQTNGSYTHDAYITSGCPYSVTINWVSVGSGLTGAQMDGIRNEVTTLQSASALFWADCDSDGYEPSWEAYAVAEDGSETRLSSGASGNNSWNTGSYTHNTQLDIAYLLPAGFRLNEDHGCDSGGGILAGFRTTEVRVR